MLKKLISGNTRYLAFFAWSLVMSVLVCVLLSAFVSGRFSVESNILKLLPADKNNPQVDAALDLVGEKSSRYWFFLIGASDSANAKAAAQSFQQNINHLNGIASVTTTLDAAARDELMKTYWTHRRGLVASKQSAQLQEKNYLSIMQASLSRLYSPMGVANSHALENDPFLLFVDYMEDLQRKQRWQLDEGWPSIRHHDTSYVLITVLLDDSPFAVDLQESLLPDVDRSLAKLKTEFSGLSVVDLSTLRFAAAGVAQAKQEIGTIGVGSSLGIVLMLLVVFRSVTPLLLSMAPAIFGYIAAVSVCWWVFGSVHLMVLVMGTSLLGLCNDYAMHFFVDRQAHPVNWCAEDTLRRIFSALSLGMLTSVIAFVGLLAAPFPGMQQLALFCSVGLLASYLTVMCVFPVVVPAPEKSYTRFIDISAALLSWLQKPRVQHVLTGFLVLALLLSLLPMYRLKTNDDVRILQNRPELLVAAQKQWQDITGMDLSQQFFLVTGKDTEAVLQNEELLTRFLREQIATGNNLHYQALSDSVPSVHYQQLNRDALLDMMAKPSLVEAYQEQTGIPATVFTNYRAYLAQDEWVLLSDSLLHNAAFVGGFQLLHNLPDAPVASIVSVDHIKDGDVLAHWAASHPHVYFVDKTAMLSQLFKEYRQSAMWLLFASYLVIALLLIWRYKLRRCFWVMLPPLSAAWLTVAIISAMGYSINLFHCLGLILVLGAGIDYTLFLEESSEEGAATWLTITLSAIATLLSFGLLSLSETAAVSALGMAVLLGISFSLILAPLAFQSQRYVNN